MLAFIRKSKHCIAPVNYMVGDKIRRLRGVVRSTPTQTTIQIGENHHIEDEVGAGINHSCYPNAVVFQGHVVANTQVLKGHEITIDYSKTETEMASPFSCWDCGMIVRGVDTVCGKKMA